MKLTIKDIKGNEKTGFWNEKTYKAHSVDGAVRIYVDNEEVIVLESELNKVAESAMQAANERKEAEKEVKKLKKVAELFDSLRALNTVQVRATMNRKLKKMQEAAKYPAQKIEAEKLLKDVAKMKETLERFEKDYENLMMTFGSFYPEQEVLNV